MAFDGDGNGIAYTGDENGVSVYTMQYGGIPVLQVGARISDLQILIRKAGVPDWSVTEAKAMLREQGDRVSALYMQIFTSQNLVRLLLDTYVIPQLPLGEVPNTIPADWKLDGE